MSGLIAFHKIVWLVCVSYFAIVTLLLLLNAEIAVKLSYWGVVLVFCAVNGQLFVVAADFKRAGKSRFVILSYVLLFVILTTATAGSFLL